MLIIRLIEEDIFTIIALSGILFKNALSGDSMLVAQLLPKFVTNYRFNSIVLAKNHFMRTYFDFHTGRLVA